ncbi:MAG: GerMN domain-containing protein [Limnochordia bacterium]|jgi:germination protein M|nr:GerMN domain-containing protein [Bacillota bacterium]NLL08728.1 GerMN domain-containing protein [Bacillota bacterium]HBG09167.1 hypothetical protein [Bacillota bacterium]
MRAVRNILIVVLALGLVAALWTLFSLQKTQQTAAPQSQAEPEQDFVTIYLVKSEPTEFHLVPVQRRTGGPASPAAALQALINGPLTDEELFSSVPQSVRLLGLTVQDGLASADFSAELITDFNGGALLESYLVTAIVNTLTEFADIEKVQILVEGEVVESIGGHILVSKPLGRAH